MLHAPSMNDSDPHQSMGHLQGGAESDASRKEPPKTYTAAAVALHGCRNSYFHHARLSLSSVSHSGRVLLLGILVGFSCWYLCFTSSNRAVRRCCCCAGRDCGREMHSRQGRSRTANTSIKTSESTLLHPHIPPHGGPAVWRQLEGNGVVVSIGRTWTHFSRRFASNARGLNTNTSHGIRVAISMMPPGRTASTRNTRLVSITLFAVGFGIWWRRRPASCSIKFDR